MEAYIPDRKKSDMAIIIFPDGWHGMGLATGEDRESRHVSAWAELLLKWLDYNEHK